MIVSEQLKPRQNKMFKCTIANVLLNCKIVPIRIIIIKLPTFGNFVGVNPIVLFLLSCSDIS